MRDNDGIYGGTFRRRVRFLDIKDVPTAPRLPWQNPIAERIIGTLRHECLNHVIVLNERHLRRLLKEYVDYYHRSRTHLWLGTNPREPRDIESHTNGNIVSFPVLSGSHHRYSRITAKVAVGRNEARSVTIVCTVWFPVALWGSAALGYDRARIVLWVHGG